MRTLKKKEELYLNKEIRRKFGKRIGYLSNQFKDAFEKEIYIANVTLEQAIGMLIKFLSSKGIRQILVFPEEKWSLSKKLYDNRSIIVHLMELLKFIDVTIDFGLSNYYISAPDLTLKWIFTVCNEGDFHLSGPTTFVKSGKSYFAKAKISAT